MPACRSAYPAAFLFFSGAIALIVWLQPVTSALLSGDAPAHMDSYVTAMIYALDPAIIAPAQFISGGLPPDRVRRHPETQCRTLDADTCHRPPAAGTVAG